MQKTEDLGEGLELTPTQVKEYMDTLSDKGLSAHYVFTEKISFAFNDGKEVADYFKKTKPLTMRIEDGELYYTLPGINDNEELFTINTENSFSTSNEWLYDKLVNVESIFPNISKTSISTEMTGFYMTFVIGSILQKEFASEFEEVTETFNFKTWKQEGEDALSYSELAKEWIQMGSETVKMIAAAAKYALVRNGKKTDALSLLELPTDMDSKYKLLLNKIDIVRFEYDNCKLSEERTRNMSKLEIKQLIRERDDAINSIITSDPKLHQIHRLCHLNSNIIDPSVKRGYILKAKKHCIILFKELYGIDVDKENTDHLIILKKIQNKLKREAIRANLNRRFKAEVEKYKNNSDGYIAPNFV